MAFAHKQRIADVVNGVQGVSVRQQIKFLETPTHSRKELLELMKKSGLSPTEFYIQRIKDAEIIEVIEVGHP